MNRAFCIQLCVIVCWGVWFSASIATAQPVCAVIDRAKQPLSELLEARLLANSAATWVERTEIDRILGEQELNAAFGAEGGQSRSSLGQLVKADVLVLLRTAKNPTPDAPPLVECVVCETKRGLRLRTLTVTPSENLEELAVTLEEQVLQGLKKQKEEITTLVAVPPFLSDDLGLEFNYLQTAYAKLVEETLLSQPGLLVLELGEAQAITKELTIAGTNEVDALAKRPLYVIGRYRHDGGPKNRTLRMSLQLLEGDKRLTLKGITAMPPADAAAWIRTKTAELLPLMQLKKVVADKFSPEEEARTLALRGRLFQKVGSWPEALSLYEASLLLNPKQNHVRREAFVVTGQYIKGSDQTEQILREIAACERGYEFLEPYLLTVGDQWKGNANEIDASLLFDFSAARYFASRQEDLPKEVLAAIARFRQRRTESLLRVGYFRVKAGYRDRTDGNTWDVRAVIGLSDKETYAVLSRVADEWRDLPNLAQHIERMAFRETFSLEDSPEYRSFITFLSSSDRAELRQAAVNIRERVAHTQREKARWAQRKAPAEADKLDVRLREVFFKHASINPFVPHALLAAQPGVDLLWANPQFHVMRSPGQVTNFYEATETHVGTMSQEFDGKYVWMTGARLQKPLLLEAIDASGKHIEFSTDDGLPEMPLDQTEIKLAPLAPGKVCVVGYSGRTWIAIAEITDNGTRRVEVFFEAREVATGEDESHRHNPKIAFTPTRMVTLRDGKGNCQVLVGRSANSPLVRASPLIIDPIAKRVSIAPFTCPEWDHGGDKFLARSTDAIYFYEHQDSLNLMRVRFPCDKKEMCIERCPEGWLIFNDRGLHIVGKKWWLADVTAGKVTTIIEHPSWYYMNGYASSDDLGESNDFGVNFDKTTMLECVYLSNHFGPLACVKKGSDPRYYQLNTDPPEVKK